LGGYKQARLRNAFPGGCENGVVDVPPLGALQYDVV
jgi:hypothetical protein